MKTNEYSIANVDRTKKKKPVRCVSFSIFSTIVYRNCFVVSIRIYEHPLIYRKKKTVLSKLHVRFPPPFHQILYLFINSYTDSVIRV